MSVREELNKEYPDQEIAFYAGYRYNDNKKEQLYYNIKEERLMHFKANKPFYLSEYLSTAYAIGTCIILYKRTAEGKSYCGTATKGDEVCPEELIVQWNAEQKASQSLKSCKDEYKEVWKENLQPIRQAYKEAGWQAREHILACVIRAITG